MIMGQSGPYLAKTTHDHGSDERQGHLVNGQARRERLTADSTARIEALAVLVSMPTPQ